MPEYYRLRGGGHRGGKGGRAVWFSLFVAAVLLAVLLLFNGRLYPGIASLAAAEARNAAERRMAGAFAATLAAGGERYEDLVRVTYRADGGVASLSCRMPALNAARNDLFLAVLDGLSAEDAVTVAVPLGNLFGGEAFSGRGPAWEVRVLLAEGASAHMESEFTSAGINQTLHRVLFSVTLHVTLLMPRAPTTETVTATYCVAETVIVGEVPEAFTQISRLTDDITEQEIDDKFDYGAEPIDKR